MDDNKRLIPMTIKHLDGDKWLISIKDGESYSVKGDFDSIKKVCRRIKAKDGENNNKCRSAKVGTYASMISENDNEEHCINVWKSKVPHSVEEFKKLMEGDVMKSIKLTKNYIIEGNIFKKGTIVEFKEADESEGISFLPTDVWEKVKDISDETERFEFVKKEVGDEFSDDEIKNFLDKYKSNLNESLTEEVEGLDDMIEMINEILRSEEKYNADEIKKIIEVSKKDKELLDDWNDLLNADDKSFNRKEIVFWSTFDKLCVEVKKEYFGKADNKGENGDK